MNAMTPNVFLRSGTVFANSRDVAAYFEKDHRHVLRDIDQLIEKQQSPKLDEGISIPTGWIVERIEPRPADNPGRPFRSFDMTRDGFTLLAMGFTGAKAMRFKLAYIEAFNRMEGELHNQAVLPPAADTEIPLNERRLWVDAIALALRVEGRSAARRLWALSPLPTISTVGGHADPQAAAPPDLDSQGCLDHLRSWRPRDDGPTIAEMVAAGANWAETLNRLGLRLNPPGWEGYVAVASTAAFRPLAHRFAGTRWAAGGWAVALAALPGARKDRKTMRIGDVVTRGVLLSRAVLSTAFNQ
jgi:Rha family phage regulatory protein